MKEADDRWDWADDTIDLVQLAREFLMDVRHLCPMRQGAQVMFLVKAVIKSQEIVKPAVVTYGVGVEILRQRTVMFVVVLYVDERQRQKERPHVAK